MKAMITTAMLATTLLPLVLSPAEAATLTCKDLFASKAAEQSKTESPFQYPASAKERARKQVENFVWPKNQAPAEYKSLIDSMNSALMDQSVSQRPVVDVPVGSTQWRGPKSLRYLNSGSNGIAIAGRVSFTALNWHVSRGENIFRIALETYADMAMDFGVRKALSGKVFQELRKRTNEIIRVATANEVIRVTDAKASESPQKYADLIVDLIADLARLEKQLNEDLSSLLVQPDRTSSQADYDQYANQMSRSTADFIKSYYRMNSSNEALATALDTFRPLFEIQAMRVWRESLYFQNVTAMTARLQRSAQNIEARANDPKAVAAEIRWVVNEALVLREKIEDQPRYQPAE